MKLCDGLLLARNHCTYFLHKAAPFPLFFLFLTSAFMFCCFSFSFLPPTLCAVVQIVVVVGVGGGVSGGVAVVCVFVVVIFFLILGNL